MNRMTGRVIDDRIPNARVQMSKRVKRRAVKTRTRELTGSIDQCLPEILENDSLRALILRFRGERLANQ